MIENSAKGPTESSGPRVGLWVSEHVFHSETSDSRGESPQDGPT